MNLVARFVTRGTDDETDGFIVGALMKNGKQFFCPGQVYEIRECVGEFIIRHVGPSWIERTITPRKPFCWGNGVDHILLCGKLLTLSEDEYEALCTRKGRDHG